MKILILTVLGTIGVALGATSDVDPGSQPSARGEYVVTRQGIIHGATVGSVHEFLGVPFAAPPTGDLRWRPPAPPAHWSGVREATTKGSACAQLLSPGSDIPMASEDCLYLNVYRPKERVPGGPRPVLVFIHGGSNTGGSGNEFDPSQMVRETGLIVVMINYRLGVFGFLAIPALDAQSEEPDSGNYAIMDQQAALRWVRENILAFGGDPANVTVGGHSAGATDVCASLVSPAAHGLFSKAILESRNCLTVTHQQALVQGEKVAASLGCTDTTTAATCMRAKSADDLLTATASDQANPNVGGRLLPLEPLQALASGHWNRVPVLLGSTHDEATGAVALQLRNAGIPDPFNLTGQQYEQIVQRTFKTLAPTVLAEYSPVQNPFYTFAAENTDGQIACTISSIGRTISVLTPTFQYEFADPSPPLPNGWPLVPPPGFGAYHGAELQYLFHLDSETGSKTLAQQQLAARMIHHWGAFVRTGNPNSPGLTGWPAELPGIQNVLSLRPDGDEVILDFDLAHHCELWDSITR
jgi:para-nitrobenzyl esterase